ncbi:hypothetical protein BS50DRAFT_582114 [Corynespora cassiicola Philippines]|uniref:Uncharacterized protein n=1 Tax=Corynespora cassiicola Philippines TaxID=1448308 RepID=A0A2T2PCL7_CORCC|nr:hypothetical protein BS50DRAFT_582114 [Corynespora cassiicola Philippines]
MPAENKLTAALASTQRMSYWKTTKVFLRWLFCERGRTLSEVELFYLKNSHSRLPQLPDDYFSEPYYIDQQDYLDQLQRANLIRALLGHHPGGASDEYFDFDSDLPEGSFPVRHWRLTAFLTRPLVYTWDLVNHLNLFVPKPRPALMEEPIDQTLFFEFSCYCEYEVEQFPEVEWTENGLVALRRTYSNEIIEFEIAKPEKFDREKFEAIVQEKFLPPRMKTNYGELGLYVEAELGFYEQEYERDTVPAVQSLLNSYVSTVYPIDYYWRVFGLYRNKCSMILDICIETPAEKEIVVTGRLSISELPGGMPNSYE